MADEKKLTSEELTDEQANEAAGGYIHPKSTKLEHERCAQCGKLKIVDEMVYTYINGERRLVCFRCAGVR